MRAGLLRHRVKIQKPVETVNAHGDAISTWQDFAEVDAGIMPLSAREFFHAQQTQSDITHKVSLRYLPGVNSKMRILFGSRVFHIASVMNRDERNTEFELLCKETL